MAELPQKHRVSVSGVLKILGVSRSGYRAWKQRVPSVSEKHRDHIKDAIKQIYDGSHQNYGAPKITEMLHRQGESIAEKTVGNYMRQMGIKAQWVKPYTVTTIDSDFSSELQNILDEQFNPSRPDAVWVSDITYIWTYNGFVYLTSIMDLYSRKIIAWVLSQSLEAIHVVECVNKAKQMRNVTSPLVFHSDRGIQFVSQAFQKVTEGMINSYSKKAYPWDNACIESFHSLLKREWLNRFKRSSEITINILSNAVKYTGEGGNISCTLNQYPGEKEGWSVLELIIADNGIGMSEEFQKHIFESFSQERSSSDSGIEGSGLGMGIVKKLVDLMNGKITVQSKPGAGSTFTITLPLKIANAEERNPKHADGQLNIKKLEGKRVLLVEDNDLNAEIATELLTEEGIMIERAENGVACIDMFNKAKQNYYSLILMDIQMPIMNGYEASRRIRELKDGNKSQIPIVAMTANAFEEDKKMALTSGMNDHVAKPIDMNVLLPTIMKYM